MVAKKAWIPAKGTYSVDNSSEAFDPTNGQVSFSSQQPSDIGPTSQASNEKYSSAKQLVEDNQYLKDFLNVASLANLAKVHKTGDEWHARGDPTEIAMQVFATRFNWNNARWTTGGNAAWKQLAEFPFDSDVKRMSVLFEQIESKQKYVFSKGAVERITAACTSIHLRDGEDAVSMTEELEQDILNNMEALAAQGLRVLALASRSYEGAYKEGMEMDRKEIEQGLAFRGLIGLYDPPRLESAVSVKDCQSAGIVVHMVRHRFLLTIQ
jgi:Na+-exporting ATPase